MSSPSQPDRSRNASGRSGAGRPTSGKPGGKNSGGGTSRGKTSGKPNGTGGAKPSGAKSYGKPGDKRSATGKPGDKRSATGKPGDKRSATGSSASSARRPANGRMTTARSERPRDDDRPRGPRVPEDITGQEIDRRVAAELRTLPDTLAEKVARLLVATSMAMDEDPDLALQYATEAKRLAGRVSVVREAMGLAAYAAGDYSEALSELRAVRRLTGDQSHVPLMADCERGLGRPRKALELLAEVPEDQLPDDVRVEARIVAAGARRDLEQPDAALLLLQIPALNARRTEPWLARLRYAYADTLLQLGRVQDARTWFLRAAESDLDGLTDAADRVAEIDGVVFEGDWTEDDIDDAEGAAQRDTEAASPEVVPGPST